VRFLCWLFGHKIRPMPMYVSLINCNIEAAESGLTIRNDTETKCLRCGQLT
jgi:hypothetical protein